MKMVRWSIASFVQDKHSNSLSSISYSKALYLYNYTQLVLQNGLTYCATAHWTLKLLPCFNAIKTRYGTI